MTTDDRMFRSYYNEDAEKELLDFLVKEIQEEIDKEVLASLLSQIKKDKELVESIIPKKLFEV